MSPYNDCSSSPYYDGYDLEAGSIHYDSYTGEVIATMGKQPGSLLIATLEKRHDLPVIATMGKQPKSLSSLFGEVVWPASGRCDGEAGKFWREGTGGGGGGSLVFLTQLLVFDRL